MSATLLKNKKWFDENAVDVEFIKAHENLDPRGPRHQPISSSIVLTKFRDKAESLGLKLINEKGALRRTGDAFMYVAEVDDGRDDDYRLSVGFRNFGDRSLSLHFACGASVLCCCNGILSSLIRPASIRHTTGNLAIGDLSRLDNKLNYAFEHFAADGKSTADQIAYMKETPYSDDLLGRYIVELGRTHEIGNSHIMNILHEVDTPSYNRKDDNSAWRIMNAGTTVTTHKIKNPMQAARTSQLMQNTLMKLIKPGFVPLGDAIDVEVVD